MKVLHVCAVAFGLETLLLPQIDYLRGRGLSVEAACSPDPRVNKLRARGYTIHEIQIDRRISPVPNSKSVLELVDFIGEQGLDSQVTFGGFRDDVQLAFFALYLNQPHWFLLVAALVAICG